MCVDDGRREPLKPFPVRSRPSIDTGLAVPSAATRAASSLDGEGGHSARERLPVFAVPVRVRAKRAVEKLDGDCQHQSFNSGQVARIALRRFLLGVRRRGGRVPSVEWDSSGFCVLEGALEQLAGSHGAAKFEFHISLLAEPSRIGFLGPQLRTGSQRETSSKREHVRVQAQSHQKGSGCCVGPPRNDPTRQRLAAVGQGKGSHAV